EPGPDGAVPDDVVERAAAGHAVAGDPHWDALLAAEAASLVEPELSAAWLVAPITARRRIADAQELVDDLPATFTSLEQGRIDEIRARVIAEATHPLHPELRGRAEQLILDRARRGMTPGDLGRLAAKIVADLDPDAANTRDEQARARRGTSVRNLGDDLARFTADLAVEDAALTEAFLDLLAHAIPPEARAGRGLSQLRADIFADLFTELADTGLIDLRGTRPHTGTTEPDPTPLAATDPTGPGSTDAAAATPPPTAAGLLARLRSSAWQTRIDPNCQRRGGLLSLVRLPTGVRVNLDITIALSTLAGRDDLSAHLTGLGVITADTVRALVTNNPPDPPTGKPPDTGDRGGGEPVPPGPPGPEPHNNGGIHHHSPDCGTILDFGRTTYRPPAPVTDRINTRDARCRFPGCALPATRCDHDHRTPYDQGGATCPCNLDTLCRFHHRIKTFTTWTADHDHTTNTLTWTSPLGHTHTDTPAPDLPTGTPLNLADPPNLADAAVTEPVPGDGLAVGDEDCRHTDRYVA